METKIMSEGRRKLLRKLFFTMIYISSFTFGGGFVIITFMKRKFVDELHWLEEEDMLNLTALAESCPGAIAVNAAVLVGVRMAGFEGMVVAVIGTIIPPMCILGVISLFYAAFAANPYVMLLLQGMQAGVAAVILDVVFDLGGEVLVERNTVHLCVLAVAFVADVVLQINVIDIIVGAAMVGIATELLKRRKEWLV